MYMHRYVVCMYIAVASYYVYYHMSGVNYVLSMIMIRYTSARAKYFYFLEV